MSMATDLSGNGAHLFTSPNGKLPLLTDMSLHENPNGVGRSKPKTRDISKMVNKITLNGKERDFEYPANKRKHVLEFPPGKHANLMTKPPHAPPLPTDAPLYTMLVVWWNNGTSESTAWSAQTVFEQSDQWGAVEKRAGIRLASGAGQA